MGFLDNLKETSKKIGKTIVDAASTGVKNVSDEIARREQEKNLKERLLSNFTLDDMKAFVKKWGYNGPNPYEEDEEGRKHKVKLDRDDWFDYCMDFSLDKLKSYAQSDKRLSYEAKDIITAIDEWEGKLSREQTAPAPRPAQSQTQMEVNVKSTTPVNIEIKTQTPSEFDEILNAISTEYENTIRDQFFRDENAFNDNLATFLKTKFGDRFMIENTRRLHGDTGDILINGKYVLEQKYADNVSTLNQGLGELKRYKAKRYPGIAFVILDMGKITPQVLEYKKYYEEEGAKVIIIRGQGERKKPKQRFFVEKG
ncbi:MAG: hypothetical protein ACP5RP_04480 [Candidatus Micrarchaeia archaeon]